MGISVNRNWGDQAAIRSDAREYRKLDLPVMVRILEKLEEI